MKFALPAISQKKSSWGSVFFFGIFLLLSGICFFVTPVHAIDTQSISAYPTYSSDTDPRTKSWFIYSLPAGVKKTDSVTVVNNGKQPITVSLYAVDSAKDNNGNFTLAADGVRNTVGGWVSLSTKQVTLNVGEHKDIPFTIRIPGNIATGDYSGGIIFQLAPQKSTTTTGMAVNVISRIGVRIYETVPSADQLNMTLSNVKYSIVDNHVVVHFTVEDTGTVHMSPTGILEVKDTFGRTADSIALDPLLGIVVPGKPIDLTIPTHVLPPILGWETVHVAVYYSPTKAAVASLVVAPNPWATGSVIAVLIIVIGGFLLSQRVTSKKEKEHKETPTPADK